MVQTGDPTNTGKGGESIWGGKFQDEIKDDLKHKTRGVLSMANSGPHVHGVWEGDRRLGHLGRA